MGIKTFSRQMFSKTIKDSFSYIFAIAITAMLVFATVNISFNEAIYSNTEGKTIVVYKMKKPDAEILDKEVLVNPDDITSDSVSIPKLIPIKVKISDIQKEIIMISIIIVAIFTVISNNTFLKKRMDELGFILVNGATTKEMSYYIRYMCSKMFIVASGFGLLLGVVFTPVFNLIMYRLLGIQGQVVEYSKETFLVVISFIFINYIYLMIASTSYVFKKEIDEIMNDNNAKSVVDRRLIKFPPIIYLILFLSPFAVVVIPQSFGDISGFVTVGVYIMSLASIGVIALYIPSKLVKLNKRKFMYDRQRKIYINNTFIKLKNTIIYICGIVVSANYFIDKILEFREHKSIVAILLFAMVVCMVIITVTLTNKIIDDCGIDKEFYVNLSAIGYSKKELFKISLKENKLTIAMILFFVLAPISYALLMHFKNGSLPMDVLLFISMALIIPIVIGGMISYRANKEALYDILDIPIKGVIIIRKYLDLLSSGLEKLLVNIFNVSDGTENLWKRNLFWKLKLAHIMSFIIIMAIMPVFLMGYISINFKKTILEMPLIDIESESKLDRLLNLYIKLPKIYDENGRAYYYKGLEEYNYINSFVYYSYEDKYGDALNVSLEKAKIQMGLAIESHKFGMQSSPKNTNYYMKNAFALISLYFNMDKKDEAFKVVDELKSSSDKVVADYGLLSEGLLNLKLNKYDEAILALENIRDTSIRDREKYLTEAYKMKGDYNKEAETRVKIRQDVNFSQPFEIRANSNNYGVHDIEFMYKDRINLNTYDSGEYEDGVKVELGENEQNDKVKENYLNNLLGEEERGNIKGTLSIEGTNLGGIAIMLTQGPASHNQQIGIEYYQSNEEIYTAYVQADGSFKFNNIIKGDYYINLAIPQNKFAGLKIAKDEVIGDVIKVKGKEEKELIINRIDEGIVINED